MKNKRVIAADKNNTKKRKPADRAAVMSREMFRAAFENAAIGASLVDLKGRYLKVNRRLCEMLGYPEEELLTKTFSDVTHPDDIHKGVSALQRLISGEAEHVTLEKRYLRSDGRAIHAIVSPSIIRDKNGEPLYCVGLWQDISERKQAEESLKETNARLQTLIQTIPDMVVFKDPRGRHLIINKAVEEVTGHCQAEIIGKTIEELLPPGPAAACRQSDEEAMKRTGPVHVEERIVRKDGRVMLFDMAKAAMVGPQGAVLGMVAVGRDITERVRIEEELVKHRTQLVKLVEERTEELRKTNEQLRREIGERERIETELINAQKLESVGILAGGIAHDFNNLLTSVFGNISIAMLDLDPEHEAYKQLATAERAMHRVQDLTRQLLTFSKGGEPIKQTVSIGELINETAGFALRGSKARCEISIPEGLWSVNADPGQVSQVIHNLIINADHAMPDGGVIRIDCANMVQPAQASHVINPGKYVRIIVKDAGVGIRKEHLPKIFDPYFTTKQQGRGLGLATAYSIIKRHGGHISAESEPGAGSAFTVFLPASNDVAKSSSEPTVNFTKAGGRILLMDDDEDVRQTTGDALKRMGYSVVYAEDGNMAVELYRDALRSGDRFDAVIMDLTIPGGMGGKETIKQLRKIDPHVRAIVSSGYSNDPVMADYRAEGFAAVVSKPYALKQLSETVYRAIIGENVNSFSPGGIKRASP